MDAATFLGLLDSPIFAAAPGSGPFVAIVPMQLYTGLMAFGTASDLDKASLSAFVRQAAQRLGFSLCRIIAVDSAPHAEFFERWLALGRAGEMRYLERFVDKRRQPGRLADSGDEFRSMIVLAMDYGNVELDATVLADPSRGVIARYAWSADYHDVIRPLLYELDGWIRARSGRTSRGKALVDTGPVLERDWAFVSGLGFTGKNCCTISPVLGSWLLLATLLIPEELAFDEMLPELGEVGSEFVERGLIGVYTARALGDSGGGRQCRGHLCRMCALSARLPNRCLCRPLAPRSPSMHLVLDD